MQEYLHNIYNGIKTLISGMNISYHHFNKRKELNATLQYPHEKWPIPDRNIGHDNSEYNLIRSRLQVDIDDCIGCLQCERACPVDCIKIDVVKPPKGSDYDCGMTINDTQKKMIVPRFSIDMSECCYCNLCVYPCPEECIYMVGGPNSERHEIDYEFSQRERNYLIYEFGVATDEEIIEAGGEGYIEKREKVKEKKDSANRVSEIEQLSKESDDTDKVEKEVEKKSKPTGPKPNFGPIDEIDDKPTRGLAKRAFMRAIRQNQTPEKAAEMIKTDLDNFKKYKPDFDNLMEMIASQPLMDNPDAGEPEAQNESVKDVDVQSTSTIEESTEMGTGSEEKESAQDTTKPIKLDIKMLNDISDRVTRGIAKKTFVGSERAGKSPNEIADDIKNVLESQGKFNDEVESVLKKIREN